MKTLLVLFYFFEYSVTINRDGYNSSALIADNDKKALRYGFQKTELCQDYAKAFICIRKCLDLKYDVAHSDKSCKCTCFHKEDKKNYTYPPHPGYNFTSWKLGAPTTSKPQWAKPKDDPSKHSEVNINEDLGSEIVNEGEQHVEKEGKASEEVVAEVAEQTTKFATDTEIPSTVPILEAISADVEVAEPVKKVAVEGEATTRGELSIPSKHVDKTSAASEASAELETTHSAEGETTHGAEVETTEGAEVETTHGAEVETTDEAEVETTHGAEVETIDAAEVKAEHTATATDDEGSN